MPKNIPETTRFEYSNEENTRSYSEKIADLRRNDKNINDNVKLRDQYFKIIEDTGYSKNRNEDYLDIQVPISALENRKLEEDMSPEDRAILQQERRDDPTIDDIYEDEELANYQYHENIKDDFEDILSSIDKDSEEYQDIEKVENLITKLTNSDSIELYEFDDFDITLDNPNLDENVYLQFKGENSNYVIDYQNFVEKNDERLKTDDYKEMKNIENNNESTNSIGSITKNNKLEIEYDEYKNKAINLVENSTEDLHTIEKELEKYEFASENYHEYLKDKYTDFNQYLKDNNISNPNEKYLDDLIKNAKVYSNIRFKMEEIDDEYFSEHGKHVPNYIDYNEEIKSTAQNLQKLKSVELEKNVIGLLPKDQQENNYRETLSRLDKNKSTLKEDLKSYISNTKIDNAINSVKKHFENVKVKAEDIQQTFKDLGQWNTDNKFVKNIDTVIDKVKNLSQKNDNKIDINDPKLLEKLQTKFKESNDYINSVDENNRKEDLLKKEKSNYLENTLNIAKPQLLEQSHKISEDVADLTETQKLGLYNFAKDVESLTKDKNYSSYEDMKNNLDTIKITSQIENDLGKEIVDNRRLEYLVSDVKKPAILNTISDNQDHLNQFINKSNESIGNITRSDLKNYQQNANGELDKIQQTNRANDLRNNDLLKKYNSQKQIDTQQEKPSNSQENKNEVQQEDKEEKIEKKQVNRGMNIQ
ncbi:hypothetical protein ACWEX2_13440 [Staphylococcus xylosus]|uniref:Uncharacterized protein n=1 Tax=Staphylococcus xylosus TaxID=1288 RepID=A0AAQ0LVN3_STAXY|nr:hypothetical protein [Staphylococcus xylosus]RIM64112.1 hypothetical protein BU122_12280 [Staphylococcus xylosus]RIM90634.1 hypothetical protein BU104_13490 [Staphylococcus xylosus]